MVLTACNSANGLCYKHADLPRGVVADRRLSHVATTCVQTLAEKGRVCRRSADRQPRAVLSSSSFLSPAPVTLQVPRARADTQHYPRQQDSGAKGGVGSTCSAADCAQPRAGRRCSSECRLKKKGGEKKPHPTTHKSHVEALSPTLTARAKPGPLMQP